MVEEALRRQPHVVLTHLPLLPGVISCQVVPRSGEVGGKQAERSTPTRTPKTQETSPRDNILPKKRKKMVVCWVVKHSKTLWERKPDRDGVAGSSKQAAASRGYPTANTSPASKTEP